jgi:acetyl esterase/lipase
MMKSVLIAASVLFFLSIWIVVPAPVLLLLPLAVVVPEFSPILLVVTLVFGGLTLVTRKSRIKTAALSLAVMTLAMCSVPLARVALATPAFDRTLGLDEEPHGRMRPRSLVLGDLVRGIDAGGARVASGVEFARPDGHPLTLTIYRPTFSGRFPIVVQMYGGAWQRGTPDDDRMFARYLASRGHVVFAIDYRHAPRWRWPAQIVDVRSALAWIRTHAAQYDGDASRLVLLGRSAGAQLALIAAFEDTPADVVGVVSFYGPTDLAEGWRVPPRPDPFDVRAVLETYLGGTPDRIPEPYRAASPLTYVSAKAPPTLLLYGSRDHIVEARFGRLLHDRLRAAGATSYLLELPWSEHAFDLVPNGLGGQVSLYYVERFLDRVLRR